MSRPVYEIAVPTFSGPLDLLLHLIERSELDITALSLTNVTDQYLKQVESLKENKVPQLIDFIVIGARLMLIKSRALLPTPPVVLAGDEDEEDPAEALIRQLKLYRQFKQAAATLRKRDEAGLRTYLRVAAPPRVEPKLDLSNIDLEKLNAHMQRVLVRVAERQKSVRVVAPRRITIEGQIKKLRHSVKTSPHIWFGDLMDNNEPITRSELSVTLLAVLEMVKRREVDASQDEMFGPVKIATAAPDDPDEA